MSLSKCLSLQELPHRRGFANALYFTVVMIDPPRYAFHEHQYYLSLENAYLT